MRPKLQKECHACHENAGYTLTETTKGEPVMQCRNCRIFTISPIVTTVSLVLNTGKYTHEERARRYLREDHVPWDLRRIALTIERAR